LQFFHNRALPIGGWLAYKAYTERGPSIRIEFKTAAGLEAGKTKVKFKEVEVGKVTAIDLDKELRKVVVTAELVAGAERYLTRETRFWVARPRVTVSRVSGLDTLLSGAYIAVDPVTGGEPVQEFVGLEVLPLFTASEPGKKFILRSRTLGSLEYRLLCLLPAHRGRRDGRRLSVGAPVLFKGIKLGQVLDVQLEFDVEKFKSQIPVLIELEPQRVRLVGGDYDTLEKIAPMQRFVEEGLRAQLKSGSLITGQLYVELDFFDDAPAAEVRRQNGYPVIPSIASAQLEELTNQAARFMNTLTHCRYGRSGATSETPLRR